MTTSLNKALLKNLLLGPKSKVSAEVDQKNEDYKKANQSLLARNQELTVVIAQRDRTIRKLHEENEELRRKVGILEDGKDEDVIKMMVNERVKKKIAQMDSINTRMSKYMLKASQDWQLLVENEENPGVLKEKDLDLFRKRRPKVAEKPALNKVDESPLIILASKDKENHLESGDDVKDEEDDELKTPTPAMPHVSRLNSKGRRSQMLTLPHLNLPQEPSDIATGGFKVPDPEATPVGRKRAGADVDPQATPCAPFVETDTVRRKRTATLKIKSLAEPALHSKLRRPGKYDEPSPFVTSFSQF